MIDNPTRRTFVIWKVLIGVIILLTNVEYECEHNDGFYKNNTKNQNSLMDSTLRTRVH